MDGEVRYLLSANQSAQDSLSREVLLAGVDQEGGHLLQYPRATTLFAAACCILFIAFGVLGNLLTILALSKCAKLRNATTAFVISLCTADLLFCTINLPPTASRLADLTVLYNNFLA